MCRKLCAFWGDQTDPKFVCGGPNLTLRTGGPSPIIGSLKVYSAKSIWSSLNQAKYLRCS